MLHNDKFGFSVVKQGETIILRGAISDNSRFDKIEELIGAKNIFDFSGINFASWLGLINLHKYLINIPGTVELVKIPADIYRYLRLFSDLDNKIKINSIEGETFSIKQPHLDFKRQYFSISELEKLYNQQGSLFLIDHDNSVFGFANHLCPKYFLTKEFKSPAYNNKWCQENDEEFFFYFSYDFFVSSTIGLCLDLISSVKMGLLESLQNINNKIVQAADGLKNTLPDFVLETPEKILKDIDFIEKQCSIKTSIIDRARRDCNKNLRIMQAATFDAQKSDANIIFGAFSGIAKTIAQLDCETKEIEDIGSNIGMRIINQKVASELKEAIMRIDPAIVSQDMIEKIKDSFNIMNPFIEDTFTDIRGEIINEIDEIDAKINECVVLLQGIDLLKQVLDHRIAEANYINQQINKLMTGEAPWWTIRDELYCLISKRLVTDQEKFSFAFFLPQGYEQYESLDKKTESPGEVLLF